MKLLVTNWLDRENPQAGGAEVHLHESFGRLTRNGTQVTLVSSGWQGASSRVSLDGIDVHRVGGRHTFPLLAPRYASRLLAEGSFDLLVEDLNKVPVFAPLWSSVPCLLVVHHLFGPTAFQSAALPVATLTWMLERPIPRVYRTVPVVAVSESTRSDLVARGMARDRIRVVENGVDTTRYRPSEATERFEHPTILYLGRIKRYKRIDLIIDAVARLRAEQEPVKLLVAGSGDYRGSLEEHAARRGLGEEAVAFLGRVSEDEKLELLRRAWVHVLTSSKEGWGITNLEASACATPVLASDSPGLRDSVIDGQTGFLVPHGAVDALASKLHLLLSDSSLRGRMGEAGREFALTLSWDRASERLATALREAVAQSSPEA